MIEHMLYILMVSFGVLAGLFLVALLMAAYHAKKEVHQQPRADMISCDKHGLIPKSCTVRVPVPGGEPYPVCIFCWNSKFGQTKKKRLEKMLHV